jgi:methylenetetrahydrofolate dehydrogenase (NADP+)/methenyltetrahydrofolate cyclohydrolase
MIIDGRRLAETITTHLKQKVAQGIAKGWTPPRLTVFTVAPRPETLAYLRNKSRLAEEIGAKIHVVKYEECPRYITFARAVAEEALNPSTNGIIIQYPLPASLETISLLDYIPIEKEIEGFKKKSPFEPPIGLAVLTMIKSVFSPEDMSNPDVAIVQPQRDGLMLKNVLKRKKIVMLGKGKTGGEPIGNTLTRARINYINLTEQSEAGDAFISQANIIISAVGQNVVDPKLLKHDVVLIGVGLHKDGDRWIGDYDEEAIKDIASAYSPTPGGVGPLNVAYLMSNLVTAWEMQNTSH